MYTDPVSDLLTRLRNAASANHELVTVPYSKMKEDILKVMKAKGFVKDYTVEEEKGSHKTLSVSLHEYRTLNLKRISSPGQRLYIKGKDIKGVKGGLGATILSTSKGIMAANEAKKLNIGGELICEIF
ncbi:MAG: 30S ribosomal protein S8 [Candidatus Gracilibacteria bacterium]|jgi:small subunit ribosomal protein S8